MHIIIIIITILFFYFFIALGTQFPRAKKLRKLLYKTTFLLLLLLSNKIRLSQKRVKHYCYKRQCT